MYTACVHRTYKANITNQYFPGKTKTTFTGQLINKKMDYVGI